MQKKRFILILAVGLFSLTYFLCNIAHAVDDEDSQISVIVLDIPATCLLVISNADTSKTLVVDGSAEDAFQAGYVEFDAGNPTLYVSSNKSWQMSAKSSGFALNGTYQKAVGDLMLKNTGLHVAGGFNDYKPLSLADQTLAQHTSGVSSESHPIQYKILLDWLLDIPGTYQATVTYTLTTVAQ